jgi:hypothetical protein
VESKELILWVIDDSSIAEVSNIPQNVPKGVQHEVFLAYSSKATPPATIGMLQTELAKNGIKIAPFSTTIDSSKCVVLLLVEKMFEDQSFLDMLHEVVKKQRVQSS